MSDESMETAPHRTFATYLFYALGLAVGISILVVLFGKRRELTGAVHAPIPWSGILLAFGVSQIAASLPFIPGGLGVVEGSLAVILVAYGTHKVAALAVVLIYRVLTFWLAILMGWSCIGVIERRVRTANLRGQVPDGAALAEGS